MSPPVDWTNAAAEADEILREVRSNLVDKRHEELLAAGLSGAAMLSREDAERILRRLAEKIEDLVVEGQAISDRVDRLLEARQHLRKGLEGVNDLVKPRRTVGLTTRECLPLLDHVDKVLRDEAEGFDQ